MIGKNAIYVGIIFIIGLNASCAVRETYVVRERPAEVVYVRPVAPAGAHIWIAGEWEWKGGGYRWREGRWERPREGYRYHEGHWKNSRDGWKWEHGGWENY